MKKIKIAAIILLVHGVIEILGPVGTLFASATGNVDISEYMHFIVPFFQSNVALVSGTSLIYGIIRIIGAIALFKNRLWGFALAIICSVVTLTLMMFVLPAGIMDGVLAGAVLVLVLNAHYGDKKIIE